MLSSNIFSLILIYITVICYFVLFKKDMFYYKTEDGYKLKSFGFGSNKSILNLYSFSIILCIFLIFMYYYLIMIFR